MKPSRHADPPVRLAVVDLRGTTVDDDRAYSSAVTEALDVVDVDASAHTEALRRHAGLTPRDTFTELLGDTAAARIATVRFDVAYHRLIRQGVVKPLPGAAEALAQLRRDGVAVALTSGLSPKVLETLIGVLGWDRLADVVVSPGLGGGLRPAPAPDTVLYALTRRGIDDVRSVAVVGDTASDLLAGWRAGASVVAGVLSGAHGLEDFAAVPHTHVLGSIAGFPAVVHSVSRDALRGPSAQDNAATGQPWSRAAANRPRTGLTATG